MASPARVGVFLCQGASGPSDSLEFKRLRWTAEGSSFGAGVWEITQACHSQGAQALARIAREHDLDAIVLGACPLAEPTGPLGHALAQAGFRPQQVTILDLCRRPERGLGQCQVDPGAQFALCQALAAASRSQVTERLTQAVSTRVLVVGSGLAALLATHSLIEGGYQALLVTPQQRLAPPEPLLGEEAGTQAQELARQLKDQAAVEIMRQGEILALLGQAGHFQVVLRDRQRRVHRREVGAVIVAQGPPQALNYAPLPDSGRVISLEELVMLADSPPHLAKVAGRANPRVAIFLGLQAEAGPQQLRAACLAGSKLLGHGAEQVVLFTTNAKVAAPGLEELTQQVRGEGVVFVKFTHSRPRLEVSDEALRVAYQEEVLDRELLQEFDLLAVDRRPAPDADYRHLARILGLEVARDGSLQPEAVAALPVFSPRGGVMVVGPARGSLTLEATLDEVGQALAVVRRLLRRGEVELEEARVVVDRRRCALCLTCVRVCPQGAMSRRERRPFANPLVCTGCGTCAAECPMDAITILNADDQRYQSEIKAALTPAREFRAEAPPPEVLVLACANSALRAIHAAKLAGAAWPEDVRLVQVPCAGRIDPDFILRALREGFDLVLVLACLSDACQSQSGNIWSAFRVAHLQHLLAEAGMEPQRLASAGVAPAMTSEVMAEVERARELARSLGPSPLKTNARVREILERYTLGMDQTFTILS